MIGKLYGDDLAAIHNAGYGSHWQSAAPAVLEWLRGAVIVAGRVVDLGCGGGQWLARLADEGYDAVGVDASPAMLRIARKTAPSAVLIEGSFDEVELPACAAVTALGEPLNYVDGMGSIKRALRNVYGALQPGGLFVFDVREPPRKPIETRVVARVGDDWACIARIDESPSTNRIVRRITSFKRRGSAYRRTEEVHRLCVYPKAVVRDWLCELGFRVRTYRRYGEYQLGPRLVAFVARKPTAALQAKRRGPR
jgi:SAM-dependent methyltransferase